MKKLERMRKLKEQNLKEDIANAQKASEAAGLGFEEYELPPDEVDEKKLQRSILTSLRTFIPYTNEWYEAQAAEEEMDNLRKIRIERIKAEDLYTKAKMGKHEEALDTMMAETNYDFFYFNKLKMKMEAEGKFKFEVPKDNNPFTELERTDNRNRLKRAMNQVTFLDPHAMEEMQRMSGSLQSQRGKKFANDTPCLWRGKSSSGEPLKCDNPRMRKIDTTPVDRTSGDAITRMNKKKEPEYYQFCCYHVPFCASGNHPDEDKVKIRVPNGEGFCSECYMLKQKKPPAMITPDICPGVVPITIVSAGKAHNIKSFMGEEDEDGEGGRAMAKANKRRNELYCQWIPPAKNEALRTFECINHRYLHPENNQRDTYCLWHMPRCIVPHPIESNNIITIPNQYGLCVMHHIAAHGHPPPQLQPPFPGMKVRAAKDFWKQMKGRHFATPKSLPPDLITIHRYMKRAPPEDIFEFMTRGYQYGLYIYRYYRYCVRAAIKIQSTYRMYRKKGAHFLLRDVRQRTKRLTACIVIQAGMRRFLESKYMKLMRKRYYAACTKIQKVYRGHRCRVWLYREWAARRIAKFMKLIHFFKFKDTVIMIMQLRRFYKRRVALCTDIQRCFRGFLTRRDIFRMRFMNIKRFHSVRKIVATIRAYRAWKYRRPFRYPTEQELQARVSRKLGHLLCDMYLHYQQRQQLKAYMMYTAAPAIQKLIRGFLAKRGTHKLSYLRQALNSWFHPRHAVDMLQQLVYNKVLEASYQSSLLQNPFFLAKQAEQNRLHTMMHQAQNLSYQAKYFFIRKFIPKEYQSWTEIDVKTFFPALEAYYHSIQLTLLTSESEALIRRFKNPMSGKICIHVLDEFIYDIYASKSLSCRKHARHICGECIYYSNCRCKQCTCKEYTRRKQRSTHSAICAGCAHPKTLHKMTPLQCKFPVSHSGKNKVSMLDLLAGNHESVDMSLPVEAKGVPLDEALIPLLTYDDIREERTKVLELKQTKQAQEHFKLLNTALLSEQQLEEEAAKGGKFPDIMKVTQLPTNEIIHGLATNQLTGEEMFGQHGYWEQYHISAVDPLTTITTSGTTTQSKKNIATQDTSIFEPVTYDTAPPDYNVLNYDNFWSAVPKNPNKTVGDYNEHFNHNMPVPLIHHGELVYSFEGPQIYYNIVLQLIQLDEPKIDADNPYFLQLVMDHIQIFERHWRKMVVDIRTGKLSNDLPISSEARLVFESSNIPRPKLAKKLDDAFRLLGFHKKVIGKDIVIRSYAQKKTPEEIAAIIAAAEDAAGPIADSASPSKPGTASTTSRPGTSTSRPRAVPSRATTADAPMTAKLILQPDDIFPKEKPKERKYSLPFEPSETSILSMSRVGTASGGRTTRATTANSTALEGGMTADEDLMRTITPRKRRGIGAQQLSPSKSFTRPRSSGAGGGTGKLAGTTSMTALTGMNNTVSPPGTAGKNKRELLKALGQTFQAREDFVQELVHGGTTLPYGRLNSTTVADGAGSNPALIGGAATVCVSNPALAAVLAANGKAVAGEAPSPAVLLSATMPTPAAAGVDGNRSSLSRRRRKSQSQIADQMSSADIHALNKSLVALPRDKQTYSIQTATILPLSDDRFVCPFPGCGFSFYSQEAALRHLVVHEQKSRLSIATPQSDAMFHFYWPKDIPWKANPKYASKQLPPGSVRCTVPNCPEIFATQLKLQAHLRLVHELLHPSSFLLHYLTLDHMYKAVPPDRPPTEAEVPLTSSPIPSAIQVTWDLPFCRYHVVPTGKCPICMEIENFGGPRPPYQLYEKVTIDYPAQEAAFFSAGLHHLLSSKALKASLATKSEDSIGAKQSSSSASVASSSSSKVLTVASFERSVGIVVEDDFVPFQPSDPSATKKGSSPTLQEVRGRLLLVLSDRDRVVWIQYERLYTYNELLVNQLLPSNFLTIMGGQFLAGTNTNKGKVPNKYELFSLSKLFALCEQAAKAAAAAAVLAAKNEHRVIDPPSTDILTPAMVAARTRSIRWVPIHQLKRTYRVCFVSQTMLQDGSAKKIPLATNFFLD